LIRDFFLLGMQTAIALIARGAERGFPIASIKLLLFAYTSFLVVAFNQFLPFAYFLSCL
jgi:hypothetical protein